MRTMWGREYLRTVLLKQRRTRSNGRTRIRFSKIFSGPRRAPRAARYVCVTPSGKTRYVCVTHRPPHVERHVQPVHQRAPPSTLRQRRQPPRPSPRLRRRGPIASLRSGHIPAARRPRRSRRPLRRTPLSWCGFGTPRPPRGPGP
eukprot:8748764-Pyramimonas_sp.AAC.1